MFWAITEFVTQPVMQAVILAGFALLITYLTPKSDWPHRSAALVGITYCVHRQRYQFFPEVPMIGSVPSNFPPLLFPTIELEFLPLVLKGACVLALLGAIDSLLTSLVCDNMTRTQHNSNRELIGQGIGNMVCRFFRGVARCRCHDAVGS